MNISNDYGSPLIFRGFRVKDMNFLINSECKGEKFPADFDLETDFSYKQTEFEMRCVISMTASLFDNFAKKGEEYPFKFKVVMEGFFSALKGDFDEVQFAKLAEKNGVAILFPYLRSIICDASKMANIPPILLPSMNIAKFIEDKHKNSIENLK